MSLRRTDFSDLTKLKILNLGDNKLTVLPYDAFFELKDLEVLYLDGNKIQSLHIAIFSEMTSLRIIFLNKNQLKRLDDIFVRNFRIQEIYLNENLLESISIEFKQLSELKIVDLGKNSEICVKCSTDRKVKEESYKICDYEKSFKVIKYQDCFQNCTIPKIQALNGSNSNLDGCVEKLKKTQELNEELFQNHTKCNDKNKIPSLIKQFDRLIYVKLHNESVIREQFEDCVSKEMFNDIEIDNLMKNCSDTKRIEKEKVEEFYTQCTFCRPSRIEQEMKKCKVRFDNSTGQTMENFRLKVREFFKD
jgi:Leucine-rich repeat (LRR) protein